MNSESIKKLSNLELNPHVSVDCVVFGFNEHNLHVLLIDRKKIKTKSKLSNAVHALPGNLIYNNEDLDNAARRVLFELTSLSDIFLEEFGAFGNPERISNTEDQEWLSEIRAHPEVRVVTIGYYALVNMNDYKPKALSFARKASWTPIEEIEKLAFDHNFIFDKALKKLKTSLLEKPIGFNLLPEKFTLADLQKLYEAILGRKLDKRNFRRKILKLDILKNLKEKQKDVPHKPASYFSFDEEKYKNLLDNGFNNFGF